MAVSQDNSEKRIDKLNETLSKVGEENPNIQAQNDLVEGNEYLRKEQQRFFANQWIHQQIYQINCGSVTKLKLDDKEYLGRTVTREEENEVKFRSYIFEKLNIAFNYDIAVTNLGFNCEPEDIQKFKDTIKTLKKEMDQAEEDYIIYGAQIYFEIPKEIALKHFEEISPYVIGRKYLNDLKVTGTTLSDIKNKTVTEDRNTLKRFVRDLTEKRYY